MFKIEFVADMNISPISVDILRNKGWNVVRVSEVIDAKAKDLDILEFSRTHNKVLITHDIDFSSLIALGGYGKPSIINLRLQNAKPDFVAKRIIAVVSQMKDELVKGIIVSVDEISARYRNLPINLE